jgi:hypothetical protein
MRDFLRYFHRITFAFFETPATMRLQSYRFRIPPTHLETLPAEVQSLWQSLLAVFPAS